MVSSPSTVAFLQIYVVLDNGGSRNFFRGFFKKYKLLSPLFINYYCLVVSLIFLSFINYNLLYCCFINYKIINCCLA